MQRPSLRLVVALAICVSCHVQAQSFGPIPAGCLKDLAGKVSCPPMGGEVHMTLAGQAVCGKGRCVRDPFGKITCSALPGGQVSQDAVGNVSCAGGCEEASASVCQVPR